MSGLIKPKSTENEHAVVGSLCPIRSKTEIFPIPDQFGNISTANATVVVPCDKRCMLHYYGGFDEAGERTSACGLSRPVGR